MSSDVVSGRFAPSWWLPGGHLQTLWEGLMRARRLVSYEREILTTPDGDDLVLDHVPGPAGTPRVILLHGLEGSSHAHYAQGLARLVVRAGWRVTALNFRSCARDPRRRRSWLRNRRPRLYHSGETGDLDFVVRTLAARDPGAPLFAVGVSIGGNVLLKWLGETGARGSIQAAATISVPYDLSAGARHLERPATRIYLEHFLRRLRPKALDLLARFPAETRALDPGRIQAARSFHEYDEVLTAPLHGFDGAEDYYDRSSSIGFLPRIATPTLCITSADDPFFPAERARRARDMASRAVTFVLTSAGGHSAFVAGPGPWRARYWAEETVVDWLGARLAAAAPGVSCSR